MIPARRGFWGRLLLAGVAWAAGLALGATDRPPPAAGQDRTWEDYRLLVKRNIFRRDRQATPVYRPATRTSAPTAYDSDSQVVLTGIARHDGQFVAFFEDTLAGTSHRTGVGQDIGKGRIVSITLDEVEYSRAGTIRRIGLRQSLSGTAVPVVVVPAAPPLPSTGPAPVAGVPATGPAETAASQPAGADAPSVETDSDISEILQQMLRRRQEEMRR